MTSHITVSAGQSGGTTSGFASSSSGSGQPGGFGALLDAIGSFGKGIVGGGAKTSAGATPPHPGFVHLASAGATTATADDAAAAKASADALAKALADGTSVSAPLAATAAVDATAGAADTTLGTPPNLLHELVDSLAELQKAQQDGAPVDQDLLKRVKKAIDAVANFLATQQPIQAAPADPASSTGSTAPPATATGSATAATKSDAGTDAAKTTLAALASKLEALSSSVAQSAPDIAGKLNQLAKALDPAKLSTDTISQFGLDATGASADPKLAAAINGLINGKAETAAALPQPALAAPALKLPEGTALSDGPGNSTSSTETGKTAQSASSAAPTATPTTAGNQNSGDAPTDSSKRDAQSASSAADAARAAADKASDAAATPAASSSNTAAAPQATPAVATVQAQTAQAAYIPATAAAIALSQVPVEIVRHMQQGDSHFQIRLDPADLGRIDVKLAFDSSGAVNARVTVDRPDTLALLQRDAGSLSQALTQAGLDGSKTSLQFSLSQNPFAGQNGNGNGGSNNPPQSQTAGDDADADTIAPASVATLYRGTVTSSGLNIVV